MAMKSPDAYVGTSYDALDCFALVRLCARECFGIEMPALPEHSGHGQKIVAEQVLSGNWQAIPYSERMAGDVMTLSASSGVAEHVGIVLDGNFVLHNDKRFGAIIQDTAGLRRRGFIFRNVYRWKK